MGKEDLEEFLSMRRVMKHTIKYLKVNSELLIDLAIKHLLQQKKDYSEDLDENLDKFRETISKVYFKWIIDHCNEFSTKFDKTYKQNIDYTLITAYRDVFSYLLTEIPNMQIDKKEVEENLEDHFKFLIENI